MDVVVSGRHCEVSERYREHVEEKLLRLEKHDHRLIRVEVQVEQDCHPDPGRAVKVELTAKSRGPVVRAEAAAEDKMAALDLALDKMAAQMRRAADRRKVHKGGRNRSAPPAVNGIAAANGVAPADDDEPGQHKAGSVTVTGDGPLVVREKEHEAGPITLEQALYEMELVGHDFYLFVDAQTHRPSVVYRRRGYDYGVISLEVSSS